MMHSGFHDQSSYDLAQSNREVNINEYTFAQERFDERFGLIFFMKSKSSARTIFVKERSSSLPPEQIHEISNRLNIRGNYLLHIYGIKQVPESGNFQIYFEDFTSDLQTEIKKHLANKTRFSEAELYAILYSSISALAALEQHGLSHDFIVPFNILKFSKDVYKLHDNFVISNRSYLYNHALRGQYLRYLAPELLENVTRNKETPDHHDHVKADIFALGMCILDAGLLNTEGDFINKKLMILDEKALHQALNKFEQLYSPAMRQILEDMLFPDPSRRPNPLTLFKRLPGKPVIKDSQSSGKKRKILDQIINSSSPEKFDLSKREAFLTNELPNRLSGSPNRLSAGIEPILRHSYTGAPLDHSHHQFSQHQYESLKKSSPIRATPIPHETSHHDTDISRVNVSATIKNDPLLSQFVKKLVDPTYNVRGSPSRSELDRSSSKIVQSSILPTPTNVYQHQASNYSSVLTQSQPLYATYNEPRGYLAQDYATTQKHDYLRGYPADAGQGQGQVVYSDTYRSNVSYTPYETRHLGYLGGLDAPLQTMSDNIQSVTNRDLGLKSNTSTMDAIIARALERSSANLHMSQKVSTGLTPTLQGHSLEEHQQAAGNEGSYRGQLTSSFGQNTPGGAKDLGTIYERQSSEDYTTPMASKTLDGTRDADRFRAAAQQQTNLMDTVNQQHSENANIE